MLKIGLTGGIGSGKSTVADIFRVLRIAVFDADAAAKNIMNEDEGLKQRIIQTFGAETYTDGVLNRQVLGGIVFKDPLKLEQLNALVHPATIAAAEKWMTQQQGPYAVKEAALFFEAGSATGLDYMIGVTAPKPIRIKRVMDRDKVTRDEVLARMSRQIDDDIKMRLCDFVIVNDDQQLLIPQVLKVHAELRGKV